MPRYRKAEQNTIDPYKAQPLPLGRPVAVYYRQSSEGQIGNIATTLQTVDMIEHLMRQGWEREIFSRPPLSIRLPRSRRQAGNTTWCVGLSGRGTT